MRNFLLLAFVVSLAACGSKKAPQTPANQTEATSGAGESHDETDSKAMPAGQEDAPKSNDPCEGGE